MADQPASSSSPPPKTYLLNAKASALVLEYTDRIKNHENYQAIVTNETAVLLAHLAVPELRQLYESKEPAGYKRHGELIPEIMDFYSTFSHQVDTSHVVSHIHNRIYLTSYMRENIMNARFEGKQIPTATVDQYKSLEDDSAFLDVPIFIPTKGFTKVKPFVICQYTSHIPMEGLSREQIQERTQSSLQASFMALLDRFLLRVIIRCMNEGGHLIAPVSPGIQCKLEREEPKVIIPILSRCVMSTDRINDILILTHKLYAVKFDFDFKHWTPTIMFD